MANDLKIVLAEEPDLVLTMGESFIGSAYSPQVEVEDVEGGHRVTVTYRDAEQGITSKTFDVMDGETGAQGPKGDDGYSPTVSISDTTDGHVVTITDASGEHSYTVPTYASEEAARESAEGARSQAEQARTQAETQRSAAETARANAESSRASAESQRAAAETARATAEHERAAAEQGRASAETARVNVESEREAEWATIKSYATSATSSANAAASNANTAASDVRAAAQRGDFDGYSPTVAIADTELGHTVTITDRQGPHAYTVPTYADEEQARADAWDQLSQDAQEAIDAATEAATSVEPEVAWLWSNQLTSTMSSTIDTAADAYAAPPMALVVDGASTQAGTPTPDAPVPILSVDDLAMEVRGKNLFDVDNAFLLNGYFDSRGHIRPNANFRTVAIKVVPNTTYSLQITRFTSLSATNLTIWLFSETPETSTSGVHGTRVIDFRYPTTVSGGYHYEGQITTDADTKYICVSNGNISDYDVSASLATLQLELGSTATAYEPYQGITVPDLLPEGTFLRSLPDGTKDELHLSYLRPSTRPGWAWYSREVVRNVHVMTLDGSEAWGNDSHGCFHPMNELMPSTDSDYSQTIICDQLKAYPRYVNLDGITGISGYRAYSQSGANWLYARVDSVGNSATAMKAWLAEHRPTVLYKTNETPVITTLDPIELPELPAPDCTVWCDGGSAQPTYQMQYVRDTTLVIQALEAAIDDLATS